MSEFSLQKDMIRMVALALGPDLCNTVAFVGGCTTGFFITDQFSLQQIRNTKDVDLIVNVIGHGEWYQLQEQLRGRGFRDMDDHDAPICAMRLGELRVDFMPDNPEVLGFSNRWYKRALETAQSVRLDDAIAIRLVTPAYFIATKLEAYLGRGRNDPLESQDVEDLLNIFDGRAEVVDELADQDPELRAYISLQLEKLLQHPAAGHAIEAASQGDRGREELMYERIEAVIEMGA